MRVEIKNRFSSEIILCGEYESVRDCLEKNKWAYLSRADLSGANLYGANLYGERIDKIPMQICGLKWWINITKKHIQIGCEVHEAEEWFKFKDSRIKLMDSDAVDWWKENKDFIKSAWEQHCKETK